MRKLLFLVLLVLSVTGAKAHELQALRNHYTTSDGLASNAIADIVEDRFGYIWIATWNGLSRFDGYNFCNYPTGKNSGLSNFHNRILTLTADNMGNIWMRMYDNRIFVLNRHTDVIANAFESIEGGDLLKTNNGYQGKTHRTASTIVKSIDGYVYAYIRQKGIYRMRSVGAKPTVQLIDIGKQKVYAMATDKHANLWVATDKGLAKIKPTETKLNNAFVMGNKEIMNICCTASNTILVGTTKGDIYNVGSKKKIYSTNGSQISSLYQDSQSLIWFTTDTQGVFQYDPATNTTRHFTQIVSTPEIDINGAAYSEANGALWVRMNMGGFGYYDYATGEMNYFHNNPDNTWNLSNTVATYVALQEGVIWMSTIRRGLEKLSLLRPCIMHRNLMPGSNVYGANETRAIIYDHTRKKILIGNKTGNILSADNATSALSPFCKVDAKVYDMMQLENGDIYISTKGMGVYVLPKGASQPKHLDINLSSPNVYQTVKDKAGNLWIATYNGGVNMYNGKRVFWPRNIKGYPKFSHTKVRTIALGPDGMVWAGTSDGILTMKSDGKNVYAAPLEMSDDTELQTGNNDIIQLLRGADGTMWVATNGGGLSKTTGKDKKGKWCFETFDETEGLPSNEIKSVAITKDNVVWFSADQTLCSFDNNKKLFTTFSILDGINEVSFSEGAGACLPNGEILFGTLNGYYIVDRSKLRTHNGSLLKLAITDFYVDDKRMSPRLNDTYDYYIPDSGQVRLPSRGSIFSVKFASLNYQLQHRVHYQYMLEGYDKEWHNADNQRRANYSNVPAGTYTLRIKAFLLESPDKYDERTIKITVPPYFFASTVALWIYLMLAILGVGAYFYIRQRRIQYEAEQRKKMRVLKVGPDEIAFNNKDDYDFVKATLDWLEKNFDNPSLKIEDMASQSGLSRTSFYNQLKALTGQSPKEFVSEFRMKKAYMYLDSSNMTISEIAYKTGFNDPVYFARLFKQRTGMTPKAYREKKDKTAAEELAATQKQGANTKNEEAPTPNQEQKQE